MIVDILVIASLVVAYLVLGLNAASWWRRRIDRFVGAYGLGCIVLFWPIPLMALLIVNLPAWVGRLVLALDKGRGR